MCSVIKLQRNRYDIEELHHLDSNRIIEDVFQTNVVLSDFKVLIEDEVAKMIKQTATKSFLLDPFEKENGLEDEF